MVTLTWNFCFEGFYESYSYVVKKPTKANRVVSTSVLLLGPLGNYLPLLLLLPWVDLCLVNEFDSWKLWTSIVCVCARACPRVCPHHLAASVGLISFSLRSSAKASSRISIQFENNKQRSICWSQPFQAVLQHDHSNDWNKEVEEERVIKHLL